MNSAAEESDDEVDAETVRGAFSRMAVDCNFKEELARKFYSYLHSKQQCVLKKEVADRKAEVVSMCVGGLGAPDGSPNPHITCRQSLRHEC